MTAITVRPVTATSRRGTQRDGRYSKPMAGADVIDDRLPVGTRRPGVAHHPVPQVRVLHVEQFVESLLQRRPGGGKGGFQPAAEQGVQFARAAAGAPVEAL